MREARLKRLMSETSVAEFTLPDHWTIEEKDMWWKEYERVITETGALPSLTLRVDESEHGFAISVLDDEENFVCHIAFGFATELDVSEDLTRLTNFFKSKGLIVRHTVGQ